MLLHDVKITREMTFVISIATLRNITSLQYSKYYNQSIRECTKNHGFVCSLSSILLCLDDNVCYYVMNEYI